MAATLVDRLRTITSDVGLVRTSLAVVVAILVLRTCIFRYRRYLQYKHIPGPPTTGWSALWLLYKCTHYPRNKNC